MRIEPKPARGCLLLAVLVGSCLTAGCNWIWPYDGPRADLGSSDRGTPDQALPRDQSLAVDSARDGGTWQVTTWAGTGVAGYADGERTSARFRAAHGIAIDSEGVLYVADTGSNRVRRIAGEQVSLIAGSGETIEQDGAGEAAAFGNPHGIAISGAGSSATIFVADLYSAANDFSHVIRKLVFDRSSGLWAVTSVSAPTSSDQLLGPGGVAVDGEGKILVADTRRYCIRRLESENGGVAVFSPVAGICGTYGTADGAVGQATFSGPQSLAVDPERGAIYVTDAHCVRMIANGTVQVIAGACKEAGNAEGRGADARLGPAGIAVDGAGVLYVTDSENHCIRRIAREGEQWMVTTIAGQCGTSGWYDGAGLAAKFNQPCGIAIDKTGAIYVADAGNNRIRRLTR